MNIKGCLLHQSDDWRTPEWLYKAFMERNFIDTFPYKANFNQLEVNYYEKNKIFVNPPFSKLEEVSKWLEIQVNRCVKIALLIPSRTDTSYFHKLLRYKPIIFFIKGRLKYNEAKSAPFPSILLLFNFNNNFMVNNLYHGVTQDELKEIINIL